MQSKSPVWNIENSKPFLAVLGYSHDLMKSRSTNETSLWNKILLPFFQKHVMYRLMYCQYENLNILVCGKRNTAEQ